MGKSKGGSSKKEPVFLAVDAGDASALSSLLSTDVELHTRRNADGWTPLIAASYAGEISCIQILLNAGADVKAVCKDADGCVHYASAQGHAEAITLLAAAGAPLNSTDKDGETPLDVAQNGKIKKLLQKLIEAADAGDSGGATAQDGEDDGEGDGSEEEEAPAPRGFQPGRYKKKGSDE